MRRCNAANVHILFFLYAFEFIKIKRNRLMQRCSACSISVLRALGSFNKFSAIRISPFSSRKGKNNLLVFAVNGEMQRFRNLIQFGVSLSRFRFEFLRRDHF
jgi:hypothetical protein